MPPFGLMPLHGYRRLAGRRGGALLVALVAAVALVLFQISVSMMPMPAVAAPMADRGDPCQSMMMGGTPMDMAMADAQAPVQDVDHGEKVSCPLMKVGGCFAMCASVMPSPPVVPAVERTALTLQFVETEGAPLILSPPHKPPRRT